MSDRHKPVRPGQTTFGHAKEQQQFGRGISATWALAIPRSRTAACRDPISGYKRIWTGQEM